MRDVDRLVARIVLVAAETRVEDAHAEIEPRVETRACQGERRVDVDGRQNGIPTKADDEHFEDLTKVSNNDT